MIDLKFYIKDNKTNVTTKLEYSPDGWNDEMIKYERHSKYFGLLKSYSIPLQFVLDGAELLRTKYYTEGISANCSLLIHKRNVHTGLFELQYTGQFVFASAKDSTYIFEITVKDGGLASELINKENIKYDLGLPSILRYVSQTQNFETVNQTSREFDYETDYALTNNLFLEMGANNFRDINDGVLKFPMTSSIEVLKDCRLEINTTMNYRRIILEDVASATGTIHTLERLFLTRNGVDSAIQTLVSYTTPLDSPGADVELTCPYVSNDLVGGHIDCLAGDQITLYCYSYSSSVGHKLRYISTENSINWRIKIYAPLPSIDMKCVTAKYAFQELGAALGNYPVKSTYLDNSRLMFTTGGSAIENHLYMKTSVSDFFSHFNSLTPMGMGVEIINGVETLVLEELTYFLNKNQASIPIYNAKDLTVQTTEDLIPNVIKIGFQTKTYIDDFGINEFMQEHEWKSPQTDLINELNLIGPYRMDNSGIDNVIKGELLAGWGTWINGNTEYKTKTWDDDEIYCLDCNFVETIGGVNYYALNRTGISNVSTNFPLPAESFNLFYTPHRNLLRWGYYLRSVLKFYETSQLEMIKIDGYKYVYTQETGHGIIAENTEEVIGNLTAPLFAPFYAIFTAPITNEFEDLYLATPYAPVTTTIDGKTYSGFLMSVQKKFAGQKESEVKILIDTQTNLTDLI